MPLRRPSALFQLGNRGLPKPTWRWPSIGDSRGLIQITVVCRLPYHKISDVSPRDVTALRGNAIDGGAVPSRSSIIGEWQGTDGDLRGHMVLNFLQRLPVISQSVTDQAFSKK